jgi:hypothetical protein
VRLFLLVLCLAPGRRRRLCQRDQRVSPRAWFAGGEAGRQARRGGAQTGAGAAASGSVSHSAAGSFSSRVAPLRKWRAAENIGAGFLTFAEMLRAWENSAGHRENLPCPGMRRVGVAFVGNPKSSYRKFWAMVITD